MEREYERYHKFFTRDDQELVIEMIEMIFNWRIVIGPRNALGYNEGYCYQDFAKALYDFERFPDHPLTGWFKNVNTGEMQPENKEGMEPDPYMVLAPTSTYYGRDLENARTAHRPQRKSGTDVSQHRSTTGGEGQSAA